MNHEDHVRLIEKGITQKGGIWADFGSGDGAFTLALRHLAGPKAVIYSVDTAKTRLDKQLQAFLRQFPSTVIHYLHADFTSDLVLPPLDGLIMANSLHYIKNKEPLLTKIRSNLKPTGKLIVVEYNSNRGNIWVPYPLSFPQFQTLAQNCGYTRPLLLNTRPSNFLDEIYACSCQVKR